MWDAGIQSLLECIINCHMDDAGVHTATPERCAILFCRVHKNSCIGTPSQSSKPHHKGCVKLVFHKLVFHTVTLGVVVCKQPVQFHTQVCWYQGEGQAFSVKCDVELTTCHPVVQMEGSQHAKSGSMLLVSLSLGSTACQSPAKCINARSSA